MSEIIKQMELQLAKLSAQSQKPLISSVNPVTNERSLSIYTGNLNLKTVLQQNIRIAKAFPQLPEGFYEILNQRLREKQFTDQRLVDAVNHVIDTCQYPTPTTANFISFDECVEVLTRNDLLKLLSDDRNVFDRYEVVRIPGIDKPRYVLKEDVIKFGFIKWHK